MFSGGASVIEMGRNLLRAKKTIEHHKEEAQERTGTIFRVLEVTGTAFGLGWANARFGDPAKGLADREVELLGLPVDLTGGIVLTGLSLLDMFGKKYDEHVANIGIGALASYGNRKGMEIGSIQQLKQPAQQTSGYLPPGMPAVNPWGAPAPNAWEGAPAWRAAG
jgi:hypothetical protein